MMSPRDNSRGVEATGDGAAVSMSEGIDSAGGKDFSSCSLPPRRFEKSPSDLDTLATALIMMKKKTVNALHAAQA